MYANLIMILPTVALCIHIKQSQNVKFYVFGFALHIALFIGSKPCLSTSISEVPKKHVAL